MDNKRVIYKAFGRIFCESEVLSMNEFEIRKEIVANMSNKFRPSIRMIIDWLNELGGGGWKVFHVMSVPYEDCKYIIVYCYKEVSENEWRDFHGMY